MVAESWLRKPLMKRSWKILEWRAQSADWNQVIVHEERDEVPQQRSQRPVSGCASRLQPGQDMTIKGGSAKS